MYVRYSTAMALDKMLPSLQKSATKASEAVNVGAAVLIAAGITAGYWTKERESAVYCLEKNISEESRSEPKEGKEAVGLVTLMRALSKKYPNTVCGAVYQPRQFSWTLNGKKRTSEIPPGTHPQIREIAEHLYELRNDPEALVKRAGQLGLTRETFFYKRADWNENDPKEKKMSDRSKWFFRECLEPLLDKNGGHRVIGAHKFYIPKQKVCGPYPGPQKSWPDVPLPRPDPRHPQKHGDL